MKLNLGAGRTPIAGYINIDRAYDPVVVEKSGIGDACEICHGEVAPVAWAGKGRILKPSDFRASNNIAEEIRASHVLEHFPHGATERVIGEWVRVLAPNGWLKIAVPDFRYICENYLAETAGLPLEGYCMGGQTDENDYHKAIFDERTLRRMLSDAGLVNIQRWESEIQDCAALPVSLNLMGRKPLDGEVIAPDDCQTATTDRAHVEVEGWRPTGTKYGIVSRYRGFGIEVLRGLGTMMQGLIEAPDGSQIESDKRFNGDESEANALQYARETIDSILATTALTNHPDARFAGIEIPTGVVAPILTCPRLGFTAFSHCVFGAFRKLGLDMTIQSGAYWHQGIETLAQQAVESGAKYVLCLDYDTLFDARDVEVLYGIMESRPDIGALCPIQMRREMQTALFTVKDPVTGQNINRVDSLVFDNDVTKIASGHLGLTLIRAECLKATPKPWFHAIPSPNGDWEEGHVDADIAFWSKFQSAGNTLYLANRVVVGHMELHATWPDANLEPIVQHVNEFYKGGRPGRGSGIWR